MSPKQQLEKFAQKVYLTIKNRYYDDIEQEDGQTFIQQVADWTNMYIDELEQVTGPDGQVVDWWFARGNAVAFGTVAEGSSSISIPSTIERLVVDELRYVQIQQDGTTISNWAIVQPKDITNRTDRIVEDMCAVVGNNVVFSRAFKDTEASGTVVADAMLKIPRITYALSGDGFTINPSNIGALSMVKPQQLLIMGVAKNATLPDIVQGKLSPSYVQKYNDLLQGAVARSMATSMSSETVRDDFSGIGGTY